MKKIVIIMMLIVSLILPQTVEAADDDAPYNAWDSCSHNFVKYSNQGEYCIIVECSGGSKDIQYILIHDRANRNPMITMGGGVRRFLNLYDNTRYEIYYSDYVQSLTGYSSVFTADKLELGIKQSISGFYAEIVRTNYDLYNLDGQIIYNTNYYSEATEIVKRPDWLTDNRLTGNPYMLAVFHVLDESSSYYNHYLGLNLDEWKNYLNSDKKIYVPKLSSDLNDPFGMVNCFIYSDYVRLYFCDLGLTLENDDFTNRPSNWGAFAPGTGAKSSGDYYYSYIRLKNAKVGDSDIKSYNELVLYNWDYGANMLYTGVEGTTPTPMVKPTAAPLAPEEEPDDSIFGLGRSITNGLKKIFMPSPDILYNEVNASKDLLMEKLHINLNGFNPENAGRPHNVTMTIYGQSVTLLDFGQIEDLVDQATTPLNIARVFIYVFTLWGLIKFIIDYFNNRGGGAVNA